LNEENNKVIYDYNSFVKDYNSLVDNNIILKDEISDLKKEISLIYKSTRDFLKTHTSDLKAFKTIFKKLVDDISEKANINKLNNNFKREFDLENKKNRPRERSR